MSSEAYKVLVMSLCLPEMKSLGFGRDLRPGHGTTFQRPMSKEELEIATDSVDDSAYRNPFGVDEGLAHTGPTKAHVMALHLEPYFTGHIHVDFQAKTVRCQAVDQKTPAYKVWELCPDEAWWKAALGCDWPMTSRGV